MPFSFRLSRRWRERLRHWGETIFSYVSYPWHMLVGAVNWFIAMLGRAWNTRHFRYLLQGFPALFATAAVCVAVAFVATSRAQEQRANLAKDYYFQSIEAYRQAIRLTDPKEQAQRLEQLGMARTYVEKALSLEGGDRDDYKFFLAQVLEQTNNPVDMNHCRAIMNKLAPDGSNGYAPAHFWRGLNLATHFELNQDVVQAIERHYSRAAEITKGNPDDPIGLTASTYLAGLYMNRNRYKEAIELMEKLESKAPVLRIPLGNAYTVTGRPQDALKMYQSAERYFSDRVKKQQDDKENRMLWAKALVAQQRFDEAVDVLRKGSTLSAQDPRFQFAVGEAYQLWEAKISKEPNASMAERLALIQNGLQAFPSNMGLLRSLYQLSLSGTPESVEAKKLMDQLMADGKEAAIIYFIMGSYEFNEGHTDKAREYWEKSYRMDPTWPFVVNNLAWMLVHDDKNPDFQRANKLIEELVAKFPNMPSFLGTRGQIRVKLKQYQDAIPDLRQGLKAQPDDLQLNESIAEAYEATGDRHMAEVQRDKIVGLKEKAQRLKMDKKTIPLPDEGQPKMPIGNKEGDKPGTKPPG